MMSKERKPEFPIVLTEDDRFVLSRFGEKEDTFTVYIRNLGFDEVMNVMRGVKESLLKSTVNAILGLHTETEAEDDGNES